jgi:DNA-binding CsgD family transcriptional regulator/PAS domain-containing protein
MTILTPEALSAAISDIYDCALDTAHWPVALARIAEMSGAAYSAISVGDLVAERTVAMHASPWDFEQLRILNSEYTREIPGGYEVAFGDIDTARSTMELVSENEFQKSRFYREWVAPQGLRDGCVAKFVQTNNLIGMFSLVTRADRDVITADERRFINLICPHLRRAALINDLLNQSTIAKSIYRATLDNLTTPVFLTDGEGTVTFMNAAGDELVSKGSAIASHRVEIFADALRRAAADDGIALGRRGIGVPLSGQGEAPLMAYVLPLGHSDIRTMTGGATVAVFLSGALDHVPPTPIVLMTMFDLTQNEARLALHIGAGDNVPEAAAKLLVSENTVKTQLMSIYAKTGTHRQSELVRLLTDLAMS